MVFLCRHCQFFLFNPRQSRAGAGTESAPARRRPTRGGGVGDPGPRLCEPRRAPPPSRARHGQRVEIKALGGLIHSRTIWCLDRFGVTGMRAHSSVHALQFPPVGGQGPRKLLGRSMRCRCASSCPSPRDGKSRWSLRAAPHEQAIALVPRRADAGCLASPRPHETSQATREIVSHTSS